jgi:hypothetical protein
MSNLQRRGNYTPRRAREERAYRLVVVGSVAAGIGVVTLVLSLFTALSGAIPVLAFIVAIVCVFGFLRTTGQR